jgi:metal-responsive CopG/Arc/MetJ family transcriptional regulator
MATATINISIPDALKREVEEVIAAEGYGNTSEFFRDIVRKYLRQRRHSCFIYAEFFEHVLGHTQI